MTCIVTGLFGRRREADLVIEHLVQEFEIPREQVQVHAAGADGEEVRSPQDDAQEVSLLEFNLPEEALRNYADGMRRGGILVAALVDDAHKDRVLAAYEEYGAEAPGARQAEPSAGAEGDGEERIRLEAHRLWEQDGRPEGRDLEYWQRARQHLEASGGLRRPR
jgi:hypothetical protein